MTEESNIYSATAYDDAFKTVMTECSRFVIAFVNEVFHKHYDLNENVYFEVTEQFFTMNDGSQMKTIPDLTFTIGNDKQCRYHLECESTPDNRIIIRVFLYDAHIAQAHVGKTIDRFIFSFPASAILFLRSNQSIPNDYPARILMPDGQYLDFTIPAVKLQDYSLDDIFGRNLYLLLPFFLFNLEKEVREEQGSDSVVKKVNSCLEELIDRLNSKVTSEAISPYEYDTLVRMLKKVSLNLNKNYPEVQKGVIETMGGRVIDSPEKRIHDDGIAIGRAQGRQEGREEGSEENELNNLRTVMDKLKYTAIQAMEFLNVDEKKQEKYTPILKEFEATVQYDAQ